MLHSCTLLLLLAFGLRGPQPATTAQVQASPAPTQDGDQDRKKTLRQRMLDKYVAKLPAAQELKRKDGSVVQPGGIPPGTSPEAQAVWETMIEGLGSAGRVHSFRLPFYLRQSNKQAPQQNDLELQFSYLTPSFVRARLESGRTLLRGPDGDFLIDNKEVVSLVGREGLEDRKQLDQMAAIAKSFVGLTDPSSLRLMELELAGETSKLIPSRFKKDVLELTWLRVTSPDFFLYRSDPNNSGTRLYRAELGFDPVSKAIRFAVIRELSGQDGAPGQPMLVRLSEQKDRGGLLLPHQIEIFELDLSGLFYSTSTSRLNLRKGGKMRARLEGKDFLPPPK